MGTMDMLHCCCHCFMSENHERSYLRLPFGIKTGSIKTLRSNPPLSERHVPIILFGPINVESGINLGDVLGLNSGKSQEEKRPVGTELSLYLSFKRAAHTSLSDCSG